MLVISHGFNMDGRAASQTVTDKIPFILAEGCSPIILSAVTGTRDRSLQHYQLLPWGPSGLRFDLRYMLKLRIGKGASYRVLMFLASLALLPFIVVERLLLGLQSQWSWAMPATLRGYLLLRKGEASIIYSSGGAYSAHLAGYWLKRLTGKPWIAEIHDPMVSPAYQPTTRDERFQAFLEKLICTHSDRVWWFTEGALKSAKQRNPQLGERGFVVCPGANPPPVRGGYRKGECLVFAHFGSLDVTRSLAPFLDGLAACLKRHPTWRTTVRLDIYGGDIDQHSRSAIDRHGLQSIVCEHGRLEYCPETKLSGRERVMLKMQEADCLLLMHGCIPECAEYIPSKLYEYFWASRPIFALTHQNSQLNSLVSSRNGYVAPTIDQGEVEQRIIDIFLDWQAGKLTEKNNFKPLGVDQAVRQIFAECRQAGIAV